jgi:hypothetical protein
LIKYIINNQIIRGTESVVAPQGGHHLQAGHALSLMKMGQAGMASAPG